MKNIFKNTILAGTLLAAACAETQDAALVADGVNAVSMSENSFYFGGGGWNSGQDTYEFALTVKKINGNAAICGVLDDDTSGLATAMNSLLRDFRVEVDGVVIGRGFNHFSRVDNARSKEHVARCKVGDVPWNDAFASSRNWDVKLKNRRGYRN